MFLAFHSSFFSNAFAHEAITPSMEREARYKLITGPLERKRVFGPSLWTTLVQFSGLDSVSVPSEFTVVSQSSHCESDCERG
jgi:hypothetical protein